MNEYKMINERILDIEISRKPRLDMHLHKKKVVVMPTLRIVSPIETMNEKTVKINLSDSTSHTPNL